MEKKTELVSPEAARANLRDQLATLRKQAYDSGVQQGVLLAMTALNASTLTIHHSDLERMANHRLDCAQSPEEGWTYKRVWPD